MSSEISTDPAFRDRVYRPIRRACDDPESNFQKIRSHKLWLQHELDKQIRRQRELDAALKQQTQ